MYGLLKRDLEYIKETLEKFPEIEGAIIFGSRAIGNYKPGSDVDLAVKGEEIDHQTILRLSDALNEVYPLPYFFDLINYHDIGNQELIRHINESRKTIYVTGK